jgi:hypothetical protein
MPALSTPTMILPGAERFAARAVAYFDDHRVMQTRRSKVIEACGLCGHFVAKAKYLVGVIAGRQDEFVEFAVGDPQMHDADKGPVAVARNLPPFEPQGIEGARSPSSPKIRCRSCSMS